MKEITGNIQSAQTLSILKKAIGQTTTVKGSIYLIRSLGGIKFIIVKSQSGYIQCVIESNSTIPDEIFTIGNHFEINGVLRAEPRATNGFELVIKSFKLLSTAYEPTPFKLNKQNLNIDINLKLDFRPITLRHRKEAAIFRIQSTIAQLFRESMLAAKFTEIFTPKIVFAGAEGGANIFEVKYFDRQAFLAQSPQFYKQMMVGVYDSVFEIASVFRAEPHDTARHLNEYISMDLEMAYIDSYLDVMNMETYALKHIFKRLPEICEEELILLNVKIPELKGIPAIKFSEAQEIAKKFQRQRTRNDLDTASEQCICEHIKNETGSELVFVTHYPSATRPMYAMDDPEEPETTLSFDLLMRGLEITTGGQRIHQYDQQLKKMITKGFNPANFESYLMIHKHGIPPHGGFGLGLERLTMQLIGLSNVKEASLFPRTIKRITP